jgi:hypothetical protein
MALHSTAKMTSGQPWREPMKAGEFLAQDNYDKLEKVECLLIKFYFFSPGDKVEVKSEPSDNMEDKEANPQIEALKMKIKQLESASAENKLKCLICMVKSYIKILFDT